MNFWIEIFKFIQFNNKFSSYTKGQPATKKIGMMPAVMSQLNKVVYYLRIICYLWIELSKISQ